MRFLRNAMHWAIRLFMPRPVCYRLRGYYCPVAHDAEGRIVYRDWAEYVNGES